MKRATPDTNTATVESDAKKSRVENCDDQTALLKLNSTETARTPDWSSLPDHVLASIYQYLYGDEKLNMALSCKSWFLAFKHPTLWRVFNLYPWDFPLKDSTLKFVQSVGQYFKVFTVYFQTLSNLQLARYVIAMKKIVGQYILYFSLQPLTSLTTAAGISFGKMLRVFSYFS